MAPRRDYRVRAVARTPPLSGPVHHTPPALFVVQRPARSHEDLYSRYFLRRLSMPKDGHRIAPHRLRHSRQTLARLYARSTESGAVAVVPQTCICVTPIHHYSRPDTAHNVFRCGTKSMYPRHSFTVPHGTQTRLHSETMAAFSMPSYVLRATCHHTGHR